MAYTLLHFLTHQCVPVRSGLLKNRNVAIEYRMQNRNCLKIIRLFAVVLILGPSYAAGETSIYYARYQIRSENGMIVNSSLELIPASEEFRIEGFRRVRVSGTASGTNGIDAESSAIHDAVTKLLVASGLKSINSLRHMVHTDTAAGNGDVAILNYEGVVCFPVSIQSRKAGGGSSLYRIDAEIDFAPLAFPTRWSALYMDHLVKKTARDVRMFLYSAFIR